MIIGNGLIASAFHHTSLDLSPFCIFASGVSNSGERDPDAFDRERRLVSRFQDKDRRLVYFSTISLFDPDKSDTPYIRHKRSIESQLMDSGMPYLIVRLPIMIGRTQNPHTLFNFFVTAIRHQRPIQVQKNACRYLLDIDDLIPALTPFLTSQRQGSTVNLPGSSKIYVPDLLYRIENRLGVKGVYLENEAGHCYTIPEGTGETIFFSAPDYIDHVLDKYLLTK